MVQVGKNSQQPHDRHPPATTRPTVRPRWPLRRARRARGQSCRDRRFVSCLRSTAPQGLDLRYHLRRGDALDALLRPRRRQAATAARRLVAV